MTCAQGIAAGLWLWYTNAATQLETILFGPAACARERLVHFWQADIGLVSQHIVMSSNNIVLRILCSGLLSLHELFFS
jgi:hypothetical protein